MEVEGEMIATDVDSLADLDMADSIAIVLGYGMAVAQAQAPFQR